MRVWLVLGLSAAALATVAVAQPRPTIPADWKPNAGYPYPDDSWGTAANWSGNTTGYDNVGASAKVNVSRFASSTVTLDGNRTVETLQTGNYTTIAQGTGGSLIFDAAGTYASASLDFGSGSLTIAAPIVLADSLSTNGTGTLTFQRSISGTGGLAVGLNSSYSQTGATVLAADNTFSGGIGISGGSLSVGAGGTTGSLGTGSVQNDGRIYLNRSNDFTLSNAIGGGGALIKLNSNTVTLTGNSTYSQPPFTTQAWGAYTDIQGGTLQVGNGGTSGLLGNATINISQGATLRINHSDTVFLYENISGAGSLINAGSGTTVLGGTNNLTGPTIVSSGRLANNGALTGNVVVNAGGTFGGNGTTNGSLSIASGGTLAPGNSIGTVTVTGNASLAAGSHYSMEVGNARSGTVAGVDNDFLNVSGSLSLPSGALYVDVIGYGPGQSLPNFNQTLDYNWTIATAGLGLLGISNAMFQVDLSRLSTAYSGSWFVSEVGNSLVLNYAANGTLTPVPEASAFVLFPFVVLGAAAVAMQRRRMRAAERTRAPAV